MVSLGGELVEAEFRKREKRFVVHAKVGSRVVEAFLSQTGRLTGILRPGSTVVLRMVPRASRLHFDVVMAYDGLAPVIVDARIPNLVAAEALSKHQFASCPPYSQVLSERKVGNHRIDFVLSNHSKTSLEVKGCTMKRRSSAMYPDAPTERGREHLKILTRLQRRGVSTMLVFLAMRSDVSSFKVNSEVDPEFAALLDSSVREGTRVVAYSTIVSRGRARLGRRLRLAPE